MVHDNKSVTSGFQQSARTLRRGAPIIVGVMIALTTIAYVMSVRQEALYQASADVFIDTKNVGSSLASVTQSFIAPDRVLETQALVARVPAIINPTVRKFPTRQDPNLFLARSSVVAKKTADVLTFSVTDPDPKLASDLTNAYANAYTAYRRTLDTGALRRARLELDEQLKSLRERNRVDSTIYADLTSRNQQLREREVLLDSIARLGRPARAAAQIQPHPARNAILGAILGLLLGVGLVLVRNALDTKVRSADDVEERLGLPLLGRLYEPPKSLRNRNALAMIATPDAPETEAFQLLATNLEFANLDHGAKSFMVTSANPGEGKSTTVANLAVTFARLGQRVVLVDLDLRRPVVHRFFGLEGKAGITEVALGRVWLDDALVHVPIAARVPGAARAGSDGETRKFNGSLEVLPAGPLPPNPSEFLRSQALRDLILRLEERADIVLVDAPAMLAVSDAINLTQKVDALIVLTKIPTIKRPALEELRRLIEKTPVIKLGFVVTGAAADETFGGSYGYGYGYGRELPKKTPSLS